MTVKEVFDLRKQGKIEEAYETIRPMYAVHKGKYTTLCMFWTASDILKKRLQEKRTEEAGKIFEALLRIVPNIEDRDGKVHQALLHDALRLKEALPTFNMLAFLEQYGADRLTDADWQGCMTTPKAGTAERPHALPSTAQRLLTHCFHEIQDNPDMDKALKVMPLLTEAARRLPKDKHVLRYMAVVYKIMGERDKAIAVYRKLLTRHHDSYLYAELAELTDEAGAKAALLCRAIDNQRQEKFRTGYRWELAQLLFDRDKRRAAYELQKCAATRKALGFHLNRDMLAMLNQLSGVEPATDAEQSDFYKQMMLKFPV